MILRAICVLSLQRRDLEVGGNCPNTTGPRELGHKGKGVAGLMGWANGEWIEYGLRSEYIPFIVVTGFHH